MKPIRVLLDCDSQLLREGLAGLMPCEDFDCMDSTDAGCHPDIVVVVLSNGVSPGFRAIAKNQAAHPHAPILVLSLSSEPAGGVECLRQGALGFLTVDSCPSEFVQVVRQVASGERFISAALAAFIVDAAQRPNPQPGLSSRELQVMRGYAMGKGSKAIASELNLSIKTVSTYRTRLLDKLGLRNNADLVLYAFHHGFRKANENAGRSMAAGR